MCGIASLTDGLVKHRLTFRTAFISKLASVITVLWSDLEAASNRSFVPGPNSGLASVIQLPNASQASAACHESVLQLLPFEDVI